MGNYRGHAIPLEVYHGVPKGWYAHEILAKHARLGGTYDLHGPEATEPGAPSFLPERYEWLQYREMIYRIAEGVRAGDPACVELAVQYIELRYVGSYSGYLRAHLCRCLRHGHLTEKQRARLHVHFSDMVMREERTEEFGEYLRLWRAFITDEELQRFLWDLENEPNGEARAKWLHARLRPDAAQPRTSTKKEQG